MSRRRAPDGLALEDGMLLPATTSSKGRTTGARLGRFVRTRPVAAFLTFAACAAFVALACAIGYTLFFAPATQEDTLVTVHPDDDLRAANDTGDVPNAHCIREIPAGRFGATSRTCVTAMYFLDLAIGEKNIGRVTLGVFGEAVPKSAANFRALVTCTAPFDNDRCFRGDSFHRVVPGFVIQGGSKATGHSIYGGTFREEVSIDHHSVLSHSETGVVAWAEYPIGSQFYILTGSAAKYLDKNHVVFAYVAEGMDVIKKVEYTQLDKEKPVERVSIIHCGEVKQ